MPASDYQHKPGGALKLKGSSSGGADKKKKKKSSSSKKVRQEDEAVLSGGGGSEGSGRDEAGELSSGAAGSSTGVGKTEAQRRFEEVQRKRLLEKAAKAAAKSHKERVAEFNEKLENMSEHYDIPKVGPG
ncbi:hypothetical protein NBRC10512_000648 [Rhodotorula toruloides]|uniref:RHTO0S08e00628g1_1 n=2 Tax=Rhodotorula toruloides TaxID=5286 RepID=A0A061B0L1_RHOTO|nr:protein of unknown function DUF1754, eukaryotic family protein [Rhodotorula toruloides NP11]EMS20359.1 protein of unknown function DUF1754, eukaryotic family protein [Rhodotorula toruloides NP11]CDR43361.1 RHTO0S08e00628g1_1 [Rhodotorula toruloides]